MPTLYIRPGCHYCAKVLHAAEELGIALELKSVENPANAAELAARGGKIQVPYLVDAAHGVEMYESDDIVEHLHSAFSSLA